MKDYVRIAHLSDLHFTVSNKNDPMYAAVSDILPGCKPNLIVVTGDITDNSKLDKNELEFRSSLYEAEKFLLQLCKSSKLDWKNRLFVVPGNHDYRYYGNISHKKYPDIFNEIFLHYFRTRFVEDLELFVGCINSNSAHAKINFATGKVLISEFNKFKKDLKKIKEKLSADKFEMIKKIVLLHHHPMPLFSSESDSNELISKDSFLILHNSATVMREVLKNNINLILHGHKHRGGLSKASFPIVDKDTDYLGIISAGSIRDPNKEGEISFNIVDYYHDGRILINFFVQSGQSTFEPLYKDPIELFNQREARYSRFRKMKKNANFTAKKILINNEIDSYSGDILGHYYLIGLWNESGKSQRNILAYTQSCGGLYIKDPTIKIIEPHWQGAHWEGSYNEDSGRRVGAHCFDYDTSTDPITYQEFEEIPNAIDFTIEEREASIAGKKEYSADKEELSWQFANIYPSKVIWRIKFPRKFMLSNVTIEVSDSESNEGNRDHLEEKYCAQNLHYSKERNEVIQTIEYPVHNMYYKIKWSLPSQIKIIKEKYSARKLDNLKSIQKFFSSIKPSDSMEGDIKSWLMKLHAKISEKFGSDVEDKRFELSISIYDPDKYKLKYVAFYCPECNDPLKNPIWQWQTAVGHPISGVVFKRKCAELTPKPFGPDRGFEKYLRKPQCKNRKNNYLTTFGAIPLFYPISSKFVIGVLEMATCSDKNLLLNIAGDNDDEKDKNLKELFEICYQSYRELIKPHIS